MSESIAEVSRIKFELYLKFSPHRKYFKPVDNLSIHDIPKREVDEAFLYVLKSKISNRMTKKSRKNFTQLCIGLNSDVVGKSIFENNFILFLKIDDTVEGVVIGKIHENKAKPMFYIDILCSNPVKYAGIGKKILDFFKYIILSKFLSQDKLGDESIYFSIYLLSVNNKNTINFYERNGLRYLESETIHETNPEYTLFPFIWKLSYADEDEISAIMQYQINDDIKWVDESAFRTRQMMVETDEITVPRTVGTRGGTRKTRVGFLIT